MTLRVTSTALLAVAKAMPLFISGISRFLRYILQPTPKQAAHKPKQDPWNDEPLGQAESRYKGIARRGAGLSVLIVIAVLGAVVTSLAVLMLGIIALASGNSSAVHLIPIILLASFAMGAWIVQKAAGLIYPDSNWGKSFMLGKVNIWSVLPFLLMTIWGISELKDGGIWLIATAVFSLAVIVNRSGKRTETAKTEFTESAGDSDYESDLMRLWRKNRSIMPSLAKDALQSTIMATLEALKATSSDTNVNRESHDAQKTVTEDLPELLDAYSSVPRSQQSDQQFLEQLRLIEERMKEVAEVRASSNQRRLESHGNYLRSKYGDTE